jgi:CAAX prenyl protease-like protein
MSAAFPRIVPFAVFMAFVALGSALPPPEPVAPGEIDTRWIYAARAVVVGALLVWLWPRFSELRASAPMTLADFGLATAAGVIVLLIWIPLDFRWVSFDLGQGFDPRQYQSEAIDWTITAFRLLGLVVVVPIAEELFWRSFLMRWIENQAFMTVAPARVGARALVITSVLFALEHSQWLAGLIAGLVYGWIYMRSGKLWVPVVAHAVTNGLLGAYVLIARDWRYW